MSFIGILHSQ